MTRATSLLLRIGLAFAFTYPGIAIHMDPDSWIGYFPDFTWSMGLPESLIIWAFTILHIGVAVWLLYGKKLLVPSVLAAVFLAGVVLFNLNQMDILFRDIPLILVAVALAVESRVDRKQLR